MGPHPARLAQQQPGSGHPRWAYPAQASSGSRYRAQSLNLQRVDATAPSEPEATPPPNPCLKPGNWSWRNGRSVVLGCCPRVVAVTHSRPPSQSPVRQSGDTQRPFPNGDAGDRASPVPSSGPLRHVTSPTCHPVTCVLLAKTPGFFFFFFFLESSYVNARSSGHKIVTEFCRERADPTPTEGQILPGPAGRGRRTGVDMWPHYGVISGGRSPAVRCSPGSGFSNLESAF